MKFLTASVVAAALVLTVTPRASAQLNVAKDGPVVYGHHHLNASNIDAQKKFFVDTLGGTAIKLGPNNADVVKFPNVLIFFRQQAPTGGTRGTTVNHIGFSVPNLRQVVDEDQGERFQDDYAHGGCGEPGGEGRHRGGHRPQLGHCVRAGPQTM